MKRQKNAVILNDVQELENVRSRFDSESVIKNRRFEIFNIDAETSLA